MNHLGLIIEREYLTKVKNKSFMVMTILSPIIMIALIAVVAYLSQINNNKERIISILAESGILKSSFPDTDAVKYHILENITLEAAKKQVLENKEYGLLHIDTFKVMNELGKHIK